MDTMNFFIIFSAVKTLHALVSLNVCMFFCCCFVVSFQFEVMGMGKGWVALFGVGMLLM